VSSAGRVSAPHLRMLSGLGISAAVVGGFNMLGFAITLVRPELGEKITDLFGTGSIAVSAVATHAASGVGLALRPSLVTAAVVVWGVRLAGFLFYRIINTGSDSRLSAYFETTGSTAAFWTVSALWGWLNLLPQSLLCFAPNAAAPLGAGAAVAAALFLAGFVAESLADLQKLAFKADPASKNQFCNVGLWSQCRYPNYAGELTVWTSIFFLAAPALMGAPGGGLLARYGAVAAGTLSPAFVALIVLGVSGVPLAEARNEERFGGRTDYEAYKRDTPLLVPKALLGR